MRLCPTWLTARKIFSKAILWWLRYRDSETVTTEEWSWGWTTLLNLLLQIQVRHPLTRKHVLFSGKPLASTRCMWLHCPQDYHIIQLVMITLFWWTHFQSQNTCCFWAKHVAIWYLRSVVSPQINAAPECGYIKVAGATTWNNTFFIKGERKLRTSTNYIQIMDRKESMAQNHKELLYQWDLKD